MRLLFLLLTLFILSACGMTPEVSNTAEKESQTKILANQQDALEAKNEYKMLQEERDKH